MPTVTISRPTAVPGATVVGRSGVVACTAPTAARIGAEVAAAGGNAFDAVLAAAFAETVLLPPKCGLAGDLVALAVHPGAADPVALLAIGGAPAGLADHVRRHGLPLTGGASVGVPGAAAGYAALASSARLPLARLVAPAADLARHGFAWPALAERLALEADDLLVAMQPAGCRFRPIGGPLRAGTVLRTPGIADLLEEFAGVGAGIWRGPAGDAFVRRVAAAGGVITLDDLVDVDASWAPAVRREFAGTSVWTTPLPTHGPSLLAALAAVADDASPADGLGDAVRAAVAARRIAHGDPAVASTVDGTSTVAAVDADGTAVVVVHSNSFPQFGSGLVIDDLDLVLNNRAGRGFTAVPGHPNWPASGRRPVTTLHAWAAGSAGRPGGSGPELLGATPGGEQQMAWNAQVLVDVVAGVVDPGELVSRPRWELHGDGRRVERDEAGRSPSTIGPGDLLVDHRAMRSAQVIVARGAAPAGAADPRLGAVAVPW